MNTYTPTNILVTGGLGFIGSNLVNIFAKRYPQCRIINIDALYYCATKNNILPEVAETDNYKFIEANLCDGALIKFILEVYQIDTVLHLAAQSHVDNSFSNPLQYTKDNILGTHTLLEACRLYGKIKRFIHVSTDEVYGESMLHSDEDKKHEESILCPTNPYAATKAGAELIAMSYYHSYKMPIIVTRGNNVYGPRQYPEKLIPKFISLLQDGKKLTIQGDGKNMRSFIYVDDVVNAFDYILHRGVIGEIYNIGADDGLNEKTVMEVAQTLLHHIYPEEHLKDWITQVKDREFNDKRYYISNQKIKDLGWSQQVQFSEGIKRCIKWYSEIDRNTYFQQKINF